MDTLSFELNKTQDKTHKNITKLQEEKINIKSTQQKQTQAVYKMVEQAFNTFFENSSLTLEEVPNLIENFHTKITKVKTDSGLKEK